MIKTYYLTVITPSEIIQKGADLPVKLNFVTLQVSIFSEVLQTGQVGVRLLLYK